MESLLKEYLKCRIPENSTEASRELETAAKKSEHLYFLRFDLNKTGNLRKALEKVEQLALNLYKTPWKRELYKLKEYGALIQNYLKPALSNYEDLLKVLGYEKQGHLYVLNIQKKMKKEKFSGNVKDYFLKVAIDLYILQVREPPNEVVKFSVKKYNTDNNTAHSSGSQIRGSDTGYSNRSVIPPSSSIGSKFHSQRHTDGNNLHSSSPDETDLYSSEDTGQVSSDIGKKIESGNSQFSESNLKIKYTPKDVNINIGGARIDENYPTQPQQASNTYRKEVAVKQIVKSIISSTNNPQHSVQERGRTQGNENNLDPNDASILKLSQYSGKTNHNESHSSIDGDALKKMKGGSLKVDSELKMEDTDRNGKMTIMEGPPSEHSSRESDYHKSRKGDVSSSQAEINSIKTSDTHLSDQDRPRTHIHQNNVYREKRLENVDRQSNINMENPPYEHSSRKSDHGKIDHKAQLEGNKKNNNKEVKRIELKTGSNATVRNKDPSGSFGDNISAGYQPQRDVISSSTFDLNPNRLASNQNHLQTYISSSDSKKNACIISVHDDKSDATKGRPTESKHSRTDERLNKCVCDKYGNHYKCTVCMKDFVFCDKCLKRKPRCSKGNSNEHSFFIFRTEDYGTAV